ncbi:MAG: hypothetical protein LBU94_01415 [Clostridiales bacterium]|jgi:hypothetical protein|nr:hypothetical protein [Clostridiales bacterium]
MIPRICDIAEFIKRMEGKEIVFWGSGYWLNCLTDNYDYGIENTFSYVVDRNPKL